MSVKMPGAASKRLIFTFTGSLLLIVVYLLGWLSPQLVWQDATGWSTIAVKNRPDKAVGNDSENKEQGIPMEIYWLGHSGFLIEWDGHRILTDPILSDHCTVSKRIMEIPASPEDMGPIDLCLISHAHYDHLDIPTLSRIPSIRTMIVPLGNEKFIPEAIQSKTNIYTLNNYESFKADELTITAVPAVHNGNRNHPFSSKSIAVGYILEKNGYRVYFAGDTALSNDFESIGSRYHPQLAILPIGGFSPRLPLKYYHMNPEEAVLAATRLNVATVIPCHYGTFRVSFDCPETALPRFAAECSRQKVNWIMPPLYDRKNPLRNVSVFGNETRVRNAHLGNLLPEEPSHMQNSTTSLTRQPE